MYVLCFNTVQSAVKKIANGTSGNQEGEISNIFPFGMLLSLVSPLQVLLLERCLIFTALYCCCYCCAAIIKLLIAKERMLSISWELAVGREGEKKSVVAWAISAMV